MCLQAKTEQPNLGSGLLGLSVPCKESIATKHLYCSSNLTYMQNRNQKGGFVFQALYTSMTPNAHKKLLALVTWLVHKVLFVFVTVLRNISK